MSVRRRQNWQGQQRVDVPHMKSVESAISNDFDELLGGLVTGENESYVVRGFRVNMPGAIGSSANGLQLIVENSSFLHGASNESGTFYSIPTGTPAEILSSTTNTRVEGAFTPNTDNYIGIEFVREVDDSTADQVYFWNPTTNIEITKTVPLAIILDYKVVIATSSFASNVLPVAIVQTDASNNVISITDRRPLLCRLGTAGSSAPDPFYSFPWTDGRAETFYTSTSSTSDPFFGGDKQIGNLKDFFDALMTEFKLLKGTPFWYSASAGSISRLRQDIANTAFTGKGSVVHGALDFQGQVAGMTTDVIIKTVNATAPSGITLIQNGSDINALIAAHNIANPDNTLSLFSGDGSQVPTVDVVLTSKAGQINWSSDIFLNFIGGRLRYAVSINDETQDITLADNEVAYLNLVRGEGVIPNLVFTNGGTIVTSVGAVNWTSDLVVGDFVKDASQGDDKYYEIQSIDSLSQVTLNTTFLELSSGAAGFDSQYAFGVYETNPAPSTNRHIQVADRALVPFNEDAFWLFFRQDDAGSLAKIYARVLGGQELEQGEAQDISDNTSLAVLNYIGAASESDSTPDYLNAIEKAAKEVTTFTIPTFANVADGQYFKINSASDLTRYYVYLDTTGGNSVDPAPSALTPIYVDVSSDTTNIEVAASIHAAIDAIGDFDSVDNIDGTITVTNADFGITTDAVNNNIGGAFNVVVDTQGIGQANHYLINGESLTRGEKRLDQSLFALSVAVDDLSLHFSQFKLEPIDLAPERVSINTSIVTKSDGSTLSQKLESQLTEFVGGQVDFLTGNVYDVTGITSISTFTPIVLGANEFGWYSISINPGTIAANNVFPGEIEVIPAANGAVLLANAPRADFGTEGTAVGQVYVQEDGAGGLEVLAFSNIHQLGTGAGASGSGSLIKAKYHDPLSSTLPTGVAVTIDGQLGIDGDLVLFSGLSSGNNRVYELSGVGVALAWDAQKLFNGSFDPTDADTVVIQAGDGFRDSLGLFDGTDWKFNDTVRFFSGADYWEQSSIKSTTLVDATTDSVFEVNVVGSENLIIDYSIIRGLNNETGTMIITSDGTNAKLSRYNAFIGDVQIDFVADILAGDIRLRYTAASSGSAATMKYSVKRWSSVAGGPAGIPNYSGTTTGTTPAAGTTGDVQYKGSSGNLDSDIQFKWDDSSKTLNLNGLEIKALSAAITLNDAQGAPLAIVNYPAASYPFGIIEYSIERNGNTRVGRVMIPTDGITIGFSDDSAEAGTTGIILSAALNAGNVELQYMSTSTGNTGVFKYSIRRWI